MSDEVPAPVHPGGDDRFDHSPGTRPDPSAPPSRRRRPSGLFTEGFLVALANPKVVLFFAAFLPQFLDPEASLAEQFAIMAGTFVVIEFAVELALAAGASRILPWLSGKRVARRFAHDRCAIRETPVAPLTLAEPAPAR